MTEGPYGVLRYPRGSNTPVAMVGSTKPAPAACATSQPAQSLRLFDATALAFAPDGHLLVGDWLAVDSYGVVFRDLVQKGDQVVASPLIGCKPDPLLIADDDGDDAVTYENSLGSLLVTPTGTTYWSNTQLNYILQLASDGTVKKVAGDGTQQSSGDGGPALQAKVRRPDGLALAGDGSLLFVERALGGGSKVRRIAPSGTISTIIGSDTAGDEGEGGAALGAKMRATALAVATDGRIFIADYGNDKIKMVDAKGVMHTLASANSAAAPGPILTPLSARDGDVQQPSSIAVANDGTVYFVNYGLGRVEEMHQRSDGSWTMATMFGTPAHGDCGAGHKQGVTTAAAAAAAIKTSLSVICAGQPQTVAVHDTCPAPGGDTRIAISQTFGDWSNIVEIVRPCQ